MNLREPLAIGHAGGLRFSSPRRGSTGHLWQLLTRADSGFRVRAAGLRDLTIVNAGALEAFECVPRPSKVAFPGGWKYNFGGTDFRIWSKSRRYDW